MHDLTPATPEEVYPRLKKFAKENQGLVEGVEVECLFNGEKQVIKKIIGGCDWFTEGWFWAEDKNGEEMKILNEETGEWAKPIEKKATPEQVEAKADELMELVKSLTQNK